MKKIFAVLLASLMLLSLVACTGEPANNDDPSVTDGEGNNTETVQIADPVELLKNVWALHGDDQKFPAAGGDFSEENMSMEGPGRYSVADAAALENSLNFPASEIEKIDDAASLVHMMNLNTFTVGAFHTVAGADKDALVKAIEDKVMNNQWMCGFPEKMFIATIGDYVISGYGNGELIDNFKAKLAEAYPTVTMAVEQNIE